MGLSKTLFAVGAPSWTRTKDKSRYPCSKTLGKNWFMHTSTMAVAFLTSPTSASTCMNRWGG